MADVAQHEPDETIGADGEDPYRVAVRGSHEQVASERIDAHVVGAAGQLHLSGDFLAIAVDDGDLPAGQLLPDGRHDGFFYALLQKS